MKIIKKLLWKYRKWTISMHIKWNRFSLGLCAAIEDTIPRKELARFRDWRRKIKGDHSLWAFPRNKEHFQNRMNYLDEYIEWRIKQ